jgi:hypothetical protein
VRVELADPSHFVCGLTHLMFGYEFHTTLYVTLAALPCSY